MLGNYKKTYSKHIVIKMEMSSEFEVPHQATKQRRINKKKTLVIPKVCFSRLVKEVTNKSFNNIIWNSDAMEALQESTEDYVHNQFARCHKLSKLCKKHTITKDIFDFFKENV
jgi:histone H3/H4